MDYIVRKTTSRTNALLDDHVWMHANHQDKKSVIIKGATFTVSVDKYMKENQIAINAKNRTEMGLCVGDKVQLD